MHFALQKETLVRALKDVTSALATRVVQPILNNVALETQGETTIKFKATDLDLSIETLVAGVVYTQGAITLPGRKMLEIVSKLPDDLVSCQIEMDTLTATISCRKSKFTLTGLSYDDYPKTISKRPEQAYVMPVEVLKKSMFQTSFAAASYDASSILGGVFLVLQDGVLEATATDGSRMAHRQEKLNVISPAKTTDEVVGEAEVDGESKSSTITIDKATALKVIIPAKACTEVIRTLDNYSQAQKNGTNEEVRVGFSDGQVTFETERHCLATRLISGEYPKYQDLFPSEFKYLATFNREEMMKAIERVAIMSDDRTHLAKLHFEDQTAHVTANTPDIGKAQEEVSIQYEGQVLDIAVNVKYFLDVLQRLVSDEVRLEMLGSLKPLILKGVGDDCYKYLLMPVQAK